VGHDVASSKPFVLREAPAGLDIDVHASAYGPNVVGVAFTALGIVFGALGGVELLVGSGMRASTDDNVQGIGRVFFVQGAAFGIAGATFLLIGLPVWLANHTSVEITEHSNHSVGRHVDLTPAGIRF
jgi:hypothetical protein